MPAHFTHLIFAEEAVSAVDLADVAGIARTNHPFFVLGAQGPDLFLHNQATDPSSFTYGTLLHSQGYGAYCATLADHTDDSGEALAYLYGFVTHAALDRTTHPLIEYQAGWGDHYRGCHAVLERFIDVMVIRERAPATDMDFLASVHCSEVLPEVLTDAMQSGLQETFPDDVLPDLAVRIANAYKDCLFFYRLTNPPDRAMRLAELYGHDRRGEFRKLLSVLVHPSTLPDIDILNEAHSVWTYPADPERTTRDSFTDLYEQALPVAVDALKQTSAYINGDLAREDYVHAIGNGNLDNPSGRPGPVHNLVCRPLPISAYIDEQYRLIEQELGVGHARG